MMLIPTLKDAPADAVLDSHKLMIRSGMIRKLSSGLYTWLPIGLKALRRIENIIRDEMNKAGAQEILFPILMSKELWDISGRWDVFKSELFRLEDRHKSSYALGPTHEEAVAHLAAAEISSHRALPINLYQINTKFRDEIRPRFGLMRCREFIMKDAYSFHLDDACLDREYRKMSSAYESIFRRCGLDYVKVSADSGAMGGSGSEEFMVKSSVGEEEIILCSECGYAANTETAKEKITQNNHGSENGLPPELVHTPGVKTIEAVSGFFKLPEDRLIKSLVYRIASENEIKFILLLIRGDLQVNETKLSGHFHGAETARASEEEVRKFTGAGTGFVGPINISALPVVADISIKDIKNAVCGANREEYHFSNVSEGRDFTVSSWIECYTAKSGGACIACGGKLSTIRGIEVGHVFKLGKKYTLAFNHTVLDTRSIPVNPTMGCYGIGLGRTLAAAVEQNHDDKGIIWTKETTPFHALIITLDTANTHVMNESETVYRHICDGGFEALWDERDQRPGFKFNDADLIGIPVQIIIGKRFLESGTYEVKTRHDGLKSSLTKSEVLPFLKNFYSRS